MINPIASVVAFAEIADGLVGRGVSPELACIAIAGRCGLGRGRTEPELADICVKICELHHPCAFRVAAVVSHEIVAVVRHVHGNDHRPLTKV